MFAEVFKQLKISFIMLIIFSVLTGLIYPGIVTVIAQVLFPWKANGSLIHRGDAVAGSLLIGQSFTGPQYFWSRPSATTPYPYNAMNSSGSNFGPMNEDYLNSVKQRVAALQDSDKTPVPVELVTSSGSGLDPEISPFAAVYQADRVAKARGLPLDVVKELIVDKTTTRSLYIMGEPRVNVLKLNVALDEMSAVKE
jgi:K+-transporting ATPase ATPase C chain